MTDPDDVDAIVFQQSIDRLRRVAAEFPDPELVCLEWFGGVVAHMLSPGPKPALWRLMALVAQSVAWDAECCRPGPLDAA